MIPTIKEKKSLELQQNSPNIFDDLVLNKTLAILKK